MGTWPLIFLEKKNVAKGPFASAHELPKALRTLCFDIPRWCRRRRFGCL